MVQSYISNKLLRKSHKKPYLFIFSVPRKPLLPQSGAESGQLGYGAAVGDFEGFGGLDADGEYKAGVGLSADGPHQLT